MLSSRAKRSGFRLTLIDIRVENGEGMYCRCCEVKDYGVFSFLKR